ncbi:GNAT family N-acetyltransferase [Aquabacter spiritensis]|uniref:RimJ/RimL family protein N-acetyltransferase n=1 Tax=Aquabacter spiritensis TaxID=933073 RepID=A0A4R3LM04_9HYPH|nr:GNAT family protein [Aquabacter spiritensis]TCT00559.1 RimJ/RimL family protein N-acetyltransferase [Aquabacter spiritensis]
MHDETPTLPLGDKMEGGPARRPARQSFEGRHVAVMPFDVDRHADDLYAAAHGPEREALFAYLSAGPFPDGAAFRAHYAEMAAKTDPVLYALVARATGRAVGHATYMRIEPGHRVIEVGNILFTPALARTAAATEAMYLMARHAFEDLGYRRYEWKCNALNAASRAAALRFGFSFEGVFRQHMIVKGRSRDTAWFALLDSEWPRAKAAFEGWLSPDNFDAEGRQKRRLETFRRDADQTQKS